MKKNIVKLFKKIILAIIAVWLVCVFGAILFNDGITKVQEAFYEKNILICFVRGEKG